MRTFMFYKFMNIFFVYLHFFIIQKPDQRMCLDSERLQENYFFYIADGQ
jgi:hypothetical protein